MRTFAFLFPLLLPACTPDRDPADDPRGPLVREVDGSLRAPDGRQVLLRGVNARVEGLFDVTFDDGRIPLEPIPPFGRDDCRFLARDLGMNLLRLPVNWSGIEPEPGAWDDDYLAAMVDLVDACHAEGVRTLVDLHQDAYSKEIGEDGAPLWAIEPPPAVLLEGPLTDLEARRTSPAVLAAFASLYQDARGLRGAYAEMAAEVARRLEGHPGAIGLELHNEPVTIGNVSLLAAFHEAVGQAVRDANPDLPIAFEPDSLRNLTDTAPATIPFPLDDTIYAPHVYTDVFEDGWEGRDTAAVRASVAGTVTEAAGHGAALLIGEFGHDPRTETGRLYLETAFEAFDEVGASYAWWVYEEWSQGSWGLYDGTESEGRTGLRQEVADLVARPFPEQVAGTLTRLRWEPAEARLTVSFEGGGVHRLTRPRRVWAGALSATCGGAEAATRDDGPGRFEVRCDRSPLVVQPAR